MRVWRKLRAYASLRARRNRADALKYIVRRPLLMGAMGAYETAIIFSNRLDPVVKGLAMTRASALIGCPF